MGVSDGAGRPGRVRRRHVLYLSGFDPQGPAHYHALYAQQAALQARVNGARIEVGPRVRDGANAAWDVLWQGPGDEEPVRTRYEFLRWDDIVRAHWPRGQWRLLQLTVSTTWRLARNGSLWRILQTSWPAFLALTLPAALLAGGLGGLFALGALSWGLASAVSPVAALAAAVLGGSALLAAARHAQARVQMAWLMRSASVILRQARGELTALERRLDDFAQRLCTVARQADVDEVLLVGHSSGAMLAVSVMARALRADPALLGAGRPIGLLTLGECIPLLSYQPEAVTFRQELARLRDARDLDWVDMTAPADGCCFALVDPTAVCEDGLAPAARRAGGPKRLSPRFAQCFEAGRYAAIRRDKYRCHFQYLMAVEKPGGYDYFAMTAGPQALAQRFAGLASVDCFVDFQCFGGPAR